MMDTLLATKKSMSQSFTSDGLRVPLTKLQAGPCYVTQVKDAEKNGYKAIQMGLGERKAKSVNKPLTGHLKKSFEKTNKYPQHIKELKIDQETELEVGDFLQATDIFKPGDLVKITGTSKGKGFTGVVKRWGFAGGPRTHGQSDRQRAPGSIGQGTTPGRVHKGKKMPGRSGNARISIKNMLIMKVNENGEVLVKGLVPGPRNGLVVIKKTGESKNFSGLMELNTDKGDSKETEKNKMGNQEK